MATGSIAALLLFIGAFAVGAAIERVRPAAPLRAGSVAFDALYAICHTLITAMLSPAAAFAAASVVGLFGGGFFVLPASGPIAIASFALYLLAWDFLEYAFHRAQHAMPALWAMHSLHHSEDSFNVLTGLRQFWAEAALKTVVLYPLLAIAFRVPAGFIALAGAVFFVNHVCAHMNVKLTLGPFAFCVNNPQYHRLHHSYAPQHIDKNFADLLPLWDVLFGTAVRPGRDEFPETGLDTGETPQSLWTALVWPVRRRTGKSAKVAH